jgi:hypothetical protein
MDCYILCSKNDAIFTAQPRHLCSPWATINLQIRAIGIEVRLLNRIDATHCIKRRFRVFHIAGVPDDQRFL